MSCHFDKEIIQKYIDNTIDPLEYIFLKEHLAYCDDCKKELELLTLVDGNLNSFFEEDIDVSPLDMLAGQLVDECIRELRNDSLLVAGIRSGAELSRSIVHNSLSFASHIPGSRLLKRGISSTASTINKAARAYVRNSVKKVFSGQASI